MVGITMLYLYECEIVSLTLLIASRLETVPSKQVLEHSFLSHGK